MLDDGKGMKVLLHNDDIDAEKQYGKAPRHIKGSPFFPIVCYPGTSGTRGGPPPVTPQHPEGTGISGRERGAPPSAVSVPSTSTYSKPLVNSSVYNTSAAPYLPTPSSTGAPSQFRNMYPTPVLNAGPSPTTVELFKDSAINRSNGEKMMERGIALDPTKIRSALESKQRAIEDEYAKLMEMRRQLENDRKLVDKQMARISQIGHRVEEDSEKLMQQAKLLGIPGPKINVSSEKTTSRSVLTSTSTPSSSSGTRSAAPPTKTTPSRFNAPTASSSYRDLNSSGGSTGSASKAKKSPVRKAPSPPSSSAPSSTGRREASAELGLTIKSSGKWLTWGIIKLLIICHST